MPFTLRHRIVFAKVRCEIELDQANETATVKCSDTGTFVPRFPGPLQVAVKVTYRTRFPIDDVEPVPPGDNSKKKFDVRVETLPVTVRIETPDGKEFIAREVTFQDLARFRDLQGVTRGRWSYKITGQSAPIGIGEDGSVTGATGTIGISGEENIASQSGAALVNATISTRGARQFKFDLHRIGRFSVSVRSRGLGTNAWSGRMILKDPDGVAVVNTDRDRMTFDVTLRVLNKSRTSTGDVRQWTLDVVTLAADVKGSELTANVINTARLTVSLLNDRINTLLGENGANVSIFGENSGKEAKVQLKILSQVTAETIDMHGLLDDVIGGEPDIEPNVVYTLAGTDESLSIGRIDVSEVRVKTISFEVGASQKIQPPVPAIRLKVTTEGKIKGKVGRFTLATGNLVGGSLEIEAGLNLDASGAFVPVTFMPAKVVDLDIDKGAFAAAVLVTAGLAALGAAGFVERVESKANALIRDGIGRAVTAIIARVPRVLAIFTGADFTYKSVHLDGNDIHFDYLAPDEPTPRPSKIYSGIIGRSVTQLGPGVFRVTPPSLGDTWARDNLANKIQHIVVVMMENRSYDHVLGYLAQVAATSGSDGLSQELLGSLVKELVKASLMRDTDTIPRLSQSGFPIKTQFPVPVGHEVKDVTEQLSKRMQLDSNRTINSPVGFVRNFSRRLLKPVNAGKARTLDVIGFYEADDLPFFKFLVQNYSYCEQYYCSHAGPTLPNRMFTVSGDLQFNRVGEALIDNNDSDDFFLSRAPTFHDLLTRQGIDWRVYESFPSVAMLRMFARYAADNTNIVRISRLGDDIANDLLPPVTVIEPAMHHFPQTDDHPVADMCNGQAFLRDIYDKLSRGRQWEKTLLLITYDEHGGFYDHVIPPAADLRVQAGGVGGPVTAGVGDSGLLTPYGVRVPTFVVSPWVRPGPGPNIVLDHCSIVKTILARFCGDSQPFLSDRVHASRSFESFLTEAAPRRNVPVAPAITCAPPVDPTAPLRIVTPPISRKQMREGNIDYHELTGMLARLLGRT